MSIRWTRYECPLVLKYHFCVSRVKFALRGLVDVWDNHGLQALLLFFSFGNLLWLISDEHGVLLLALNKPFRTV